MQLRELEWFTTLAETQHMTEASTRLNISQPTLSRALGRLERKVGVQLFDRHQNRLRLNRYGEIFRSHALRAISELDRGEEHIATLVDPDRGSVSLGFMNSLGGWFIPDLLNRYRRHAPSTSFELRGGASAAVVEDVRGGTIDIGFVALEPVADDLDWIPLGREELCLAVPAGHAFEERDEVSFADLENEPMLGLTSGYGLRQVTDRLCREAGVSPRIEIEVTELSTLRGLVAAGMGVAVIPTPRSEPTAGAIQAIRFSDPAAYRSYGAVTRRSGPSSQAARRFLSYASKRSIRAVHPVRAQSEGTLTEVPPTARTA
jgi:LysR family transcriptional activator of glutamate synthase operon